ncbi:RNA polymerase sigma factor [Dyadobacter fanqingshengii]|uniref:Sigma-70 family RNA polymerase sigma factor n=1 Tax=Dyadobacter fanqingshengii TaxID=2906443 RepID=A0A9X1P8Q1_9BACT|nr:sigma-70 family RNA polymerase sigma factor [Dyadobacter fanqingshengii]MCF0038670.1 sigma-70 family RNA polymerase sigma factor [Dyadobacter fanqingshengii]USJ34497.1 sigma-70 family RNA polymerase sigma factor [Dyadobacter fanqingshengii]
MDKLEEILAGCRRQDRQAQEKLYRQFYPVLFALCRKFFDDKHEILTAVNNGMLRVFKNIDQFDDQKGEFFNWLYTTVRNAALTQLRDSKTQHFDYEEIKDDMRFESDENPFDRLDAADIIVYLSALPVATRRVFGLFYLDGFSIKEIGESLDISDGTVKWHLSEGRKKLKVIFEKIF